MISKRACAYLVAMKRKETGLENRDYGRMGSSTLTMRHPSICKVGTNFAYKSGHPVGLVRSRTKATELVIEEFRFPQPVCHSTSEIYRRDVMFSLTYELNSYIL
jgi:hypothetical protein